MNCFRVLRRSLVFSKTSRFASGISRSKCSTRPNTSEQLDTRIKKANSDVMEKMSTIFGFYIPFLAKNLRVFENLGGGMFRNISAEEEDEEIAEAADAAADIESNDAGSLSAYSFPSII